ncbi:NAD-binding protein [uncultured Methanobrevibacter sp.]|uniref:NAD-binding protein n=1 Tax=uncultured Methanobrevibacter sp. TaxID=253161 RepID=UPI0025D98701|nr:NAD-binding protein [uncultured Methanobrevibacter sp.]
MRKITIRLLTKIPTKYGTTGMILIAALFVYGILGSYFIMHLNIIDSIYYSIITMATVGYGDYTPHTGIQKIFATTLALSGVALLAYVFNIMLTSFQEKMSEYSKGARKMKAIEDMDDYYIICGLGRVGKVVFDELKKRKQNIIVIEKDEEICENIEEGDNIVKFHKDASEDNIISRLAGEKCNSVIVSTGDDVNNLFIVWTIRENNPDAWIVTRASRVENIPRLKKAGANKVVSPEIIGGQDMFFESAKPYLLRITVKHNVDQIYDEFKVINKYDCSLETIDYHIPGVETPLTREINVTRLADGKKYYNYLQTHDDQRHALDTLYKTTNNIHSHLILGKDKQSFEDLIKDLKKIEEVVGINLTNKEIAEITREN